DCGDGDRGDARGQSGALSLVTLHRRLEPEATPASKLKLPHLNASNSRAMRAVDHIDPPRIGITSRCPSVVRLSLRCGISIRSISLVGQERTSPVHLAMSALPLKADEAPTCWHVRFVPGPDVSRCSKRRGYLA